MGFVLSILYLVICYLTPRVIFGSLAQYRIELILAVLLAVISVPFLPGSILGKTTQTIAVMGLLIATFFSVAVGAHWPGGGVNALLQFIPNLFAYFIVCVYCTSKRKVQIIVAMLVFVCLFVIGQGALEMHRGLPTNAADVDVDFSYFFGMDNDQGQWFYRLRGMGQIHDPNDFAQLIVCTLPLMFCFWKKGNPLRNFFLVIVPGCVLLWGAYLTHSRGSILALLAIVIVALRRRIGLVPSLLLAGVLFAGASALHYTGGREISASSGEDRTELWGEGLQLLKSHPLFGVGLGYMPEYVGKTAHNTIVVCAAELGGLGLFFWSMFLLPTLRDILAVAYPRKTKRTSAEEVALDGAAILTPSYVGAASIRADYRFTKFEPPPIMVGRPSMPEGDHPNFAAFGSLTDPSSIPNEGEVRKLGRLIVLSLTGFLVCGWFLSRAYVLTFFLLGGLAEVTFQMATQCGIGVTRLSIGRVLRYSVYLMVGFIAAMYVLLRVVNLTH